MMHVTIAKLGSAQSIAIYSTLDPRCKIQTFHNLGWQPQWISEAETAIRRVYQDQYAPLPISSPSLCQASEDDYMSAVFGNSQSSDTPSIVSALGITWKKGFHRWIQLSGGSGALMRPDFQTSVVWRETISQFLLQVYLPIKLEVVC